MMSSSNKSNILLLNTNHQVGGRTATGRDNKSKLPHFTSKWIPSAQYTSWFNNQSGRILKPVRSTLERVLIHISCSGTHLKLIHGWIFEHNSIQDETYIVEGVLDRFQWSKNTLEIIWCNRWTLSNIWRAVNECTWCLPLLVPTAICTVQVGLQNPTHGFDMLAKDMSSISAKWLIS